jgi:RNA polymerase sigma factor (sigma-70 family)
MATVAPEVPVLARDEAFEQLYRRYVKDVYHYALALLRNPADAEDVTQTTFLNAYRALQRGDEIHKPHNWLIKIAHNVARSRYARSTRRVKEVPLEDHVERLALPQDEQPNVEGVLRALGRLPFNQRAALVMRELEGRSYAEIADTLGVSVAAVETLIFRARRSLRVRTTALRSILTVPVPSSLTKMLGGGSGAGAAAGIGTGFLTKAAVALVVGGLATGIGVEGARRAAASPERAPVVAAAEAQRATPVHRRAFRAAPATRRTVAPGASRPTPTQPPAAGKAAASPVSAPEPAVAGSAPPPATAPAAAPAPTSPIASTTSAAQETVQSTLGTVDQVTSSLPVTVSQLPPVPPLPVQTPPLPKLP